MEYTALSTIFLSSSPPNLLINSSGSYGSGRVAIFNLTLVFMERYFSAILNDLSLPALSPSSNSVSSVTRYLSSMSNVIWLTTVPKNPHVTKPCWTQAIQSGAPSTPISLPPFLYSPLRATLNPNIRSLSSYRGCDSLPPIYFIPVIVWNGRDWKYLILPYASLIGNRIASLNCSLRSSCRLMLFGMASNCVTLPFVIGSA